MKIVTRLLMFLVLLLTACGKQPARYPHTQWSLPEDAVGRIGKGGLHEVLYSPDGARLAVRSSIGIWLYDAVTYREMALLAGHVDSAWSVWSVTFSPDGKTLAGRSEANTLWLWDTEMGKPKGTPTERISRVVFSPDGKTLASGGDDKTVRLWDTETGEPKHVFTGYNFHVASVAFSPDGGIVAGGSWDDTVRLWDAKTGEPKQVFTGHWNWVLSVAFSPDGGMLASGSGDGTILLWQVD